MAEWNIRVTALIRLMLVSFLAVTAGLPALAQGVGLELSRHDSSLPVEITSDDLSLDQTANTAEFSGNVVAVQGALTLTSDSLLVEYGRNEASGANEIIRVTAQGNVVMVQEHPAEPGRTPDVAESGVAVYTVADEQIVMTVNVLVVQEDTVLTSDKMTYHLPSGKGVMEGRVTTLLVPKRDE